MTLRLVARYGQMCNVQGTPEEVRQLLDVLRGHCERLGRPEEEITRSMYTSMLVASTEAELTKKAERFKDYRPKRGWLAGTPTQLVDKLGEYVRAGIQYVIFRTPDWYELEPIRLFSEQLIPAVESLR